LVSLLLFGIVTFVGCVALDFILMDIGRELTGLQIAIPKSENEAAVEI